MATVPKFSLDVVMKGEGFFTKADVEEGRAETIHNLSLIVLIKPVDVKEIFDELYCYECTPTVSGGTANEFSHHDNVDGKKSDIKGMSNSSIVSTNEPACNIDGKEISNKQNSGNIDANTNGQHCYACTPEELIHTDAKYERYTRDEEDFDGGAYGRAGGNRTMDWV